MGRLFEVDASNPARVMITGEFSEMYLRYLQARRDFPQLNHDGHFDGAVREVTSQHHKWLIVRHGMEPTVAAVLAIEMTNHQVETIEREFNRRLD